VTGVPIVDAHYHVWDLRVRNQDWIAGDALASILRSFVLSDYEPHAHDAGVKASVVVQTIAAPEETPELLALAAGSDLVAGVVGWTDLTAADIADRIRALAELPGGSKLSGIAIRFSSSPIRAG
jgi:L-fuconolactonase